MVDFQFFTVDRFGGNRQEHPNARASSPLDRELNESGSLTVDIPNNDEHIDNVIEWAREIQVWRQEAGEDPTLWWQGVITDKTYDAEQAVWSVEVAGLKEYFRYLHVGKARRTNWLVNGSFENGDLSGWTPIGVTANAVTAWSALRGTVLQFVDHVVSVNVRYQANLYQAGSGEDTFLRQIVTVPGGVYWTLSAWFHIRTDNTWVGTALDERGLYVERRHPTTGAVEAVEFFKITADTERGVFQRATANIWSPPGRDSVLEVRLYSTRCTAASGSPPGSIIWDEVQLVAMESLSYSRADVATIANGLVTHAQDPAFDKADLDIDAAATATGGLADRAYQYADHEVIYDCLTELHEMGLGDFDIELTWDDTNKKAVKASKWYYPQQGRTTVDYALDLDGEDGIAQLTSIEYRGSETRTTIIAQGEGSGPDIEEQTASNTTQTGGVVLEETFKVAAGTHHDLILGQAGFQVSKKYRIPKVPELVLSPALTGRVQLGDVVRVVLPIGGPWAVDANYRIVHTSHDFDNDQLTVQVVPV